MIELPDSPAPNGVSPTLIDYGLILRPALGGAVQRVDRAGSRFRAEVSFPPMRPDTARRFISRLLDAKREGLRIEYPLLGVSQGIPGTPVVDGAGQTGTTLAVRGLTPRYAFKEGFWLSIVKAGQHYLHNCRSNAVAGGDGATTVTITPPLRTDFPDGAAIHLAKPMIEGLIDGNEWSWSIPVERLIALQVTIEEAA